MDPFRESASVSLMGKHQDHFKSKIDTFEGLVTKIEVFEDFCRPRGFMLSGWSRIYVIFMLFNRDCDTTTTLHTGRVLALMTSTDLGH